VEAKVALYHISSTEGLKVLSPQIARAGAKNYTRKEYRTWDRPRVFFFTRLGQEDAGVGKIQGKVTYKAEIEKEKLYPIMKDPLKLSFPANEKEYLGIREAQHGMPSYYPINRYEMVATLSERIGYHGFIYPQKEESLIVALWEPIVVEVLERDFY
tara:strand:- start:1186 stop:1653 length:468 start_codon:yes stop_codon:yes gene_type:complete